MDSFSSGVRELHEEWEKHCIVTAAALWAPFSKTACVPAGLKYSTNAISDHCGDIFM